jgi:hypothetical protein
MSDEKRLGFQLAVISASMLVAWAVAVFLPG